MLRCTRLLSTTATPIVSKVQALIGWKKSEEIVKTICNLKPSEIDEHDWHVITDQLITYSEQTKSASVIPSVVIASASLGYSVPDIDKERIGNLAISLFESLSVFDKIVFTVGCSQAGVRTPEIVDIINRFLVETRDVDIPERFLHSILLAVANLGISNIVSWNQLIARINPETLSPHDLANVTLAIVTSRTFPIALIERIINSAAAAGSQNFTSNDAISFTHSLTCLEVFRTDLFRSLLNQISQSATLDSDAVKLVKQIMISLFLDEKAKEIVSAISPAVLARIDKLLDWTMPEPLRHHGMVAGEIQQLVAELTCDASEDISETKFAPLLDLTDWTTDSAKSVAMDRFYLSDVPVEGSKKLFVHIDDETYPDIEEGPIDPYLQLKHTQIGKCGYQVIWVRKPEWLNGEWEEKKQFISMFLKP